MRALALKARMARPTGTEHLPYIYRIKDSYIAHYMPEALLQAISHNN